VSEASGHLSTGAPPDWRIAPEGEPPSAKRCRCAKPLSERIDGERWCVTCGRQLSIRLPGAEETPRKMREFPKGPTSEPRLEGLFPTSATCNPGRYMDQQLNFRADKDLARALAEAASREERTISAEIRYAVRKHLNESAQPHLEAGRSQSRAGSEPARDKV
jgi:hypothetical protein